MVARNWIFLLPSLSCIILIVGIFAITTTTGSDQSQDVDRVEPINYLEAALSHNHEPAQVIEGKLWPSVGRMRRAVIGERRKSPKMFLAQRPKSTSTTTTTTTSSTSSLSGETSAEEDQEQEESEVESETGVTGAGEVTSRESRLQDYDTEEATNEEGEKEAETNGGKKTMKKVKSTTTTTTSPAAKTSKTSTKLAKSGQKSAGKEAAERQGGNKQLANNETDSSSEMESSEKSVNKKKRKKALVALPFIKLKNESICTPEAYLEFPPDLIGNKWRSRGLVIVHLAVVCYMFYSLALVCERYFMPSLEEFSQRLNLSEDVAGATLMSAGSSAPELFTAILGVFIAKGDVGTGAIVGSAVFNILFVIGICAFVSTSEAQLNWWPVLRDSVYYTFTVLVLIVFIYDERITALESFTMLALYGVYILIMVNNESLKESVTQIIKSSPLVSRLILQQSVDGPDDVFGGGSTSSGGAGLQLKHQESSLLRSGRQNYQTTSSRRASDKSSSTNVEEDSLFLAALLVIIKHKRMFRSQLRFQSAARYIITKSQHRVQRQHRTSARSAAFNNEQSLSRFDSINNNNNNNNNEVNYVGPEEVGDASKSKQRQRMEAYAMSASLSKNKFSIVSRDDYEFWNRPPAPDENYYLWLAKIPVAVVLHYTVPDCALYPDRYLITFCVSIIWTAFFSYIMVWMVTLIGYTFGVPDSVMGVTFLAAGTSIPDCYSSVHAARNGMADMAVSNSIGSNVFDILVGLSLPWFIQTAIYPGIVATINSRGIIYSVILLFFSLIVTIYLMNKYEWTLKPKLGLAMLIAYGMFIILTCMLEFNLFGHVNPPACLVD